VNQLELCLLMQQASLRPLTQRKITGYRCPSDTAPETNTGRLFSNAIFGDTAVGTSNYIGVEGTRWSQGVDWIQSQTDPYGIFWPASRVKISDITDGSSNTLLVGERNWTNLAGVWIGTRNYTGNGDVGLRQQLGITNWKINLSNSTTATPTSNRAFQHAVRKGQYKLLTLRTGDEHLFDLTQDIGEKKDVLTQHADIAAQLRTEFSKWDSQLAKPLWGQSPPRKAK
jgi:hypothetical protein